MSTDQHDRALFDGFELLTPTAAASQRAIERTRDLLLHRTAACKTGAKHRSRLRSLAYAALAATFALTACLVGIHYKAGQDRPAVVALAKGPNPKGDLQHLDADPRRPVEPATMAVEVKPPQKGNLPAGDAPLDTRDYYAVPIIHAQVADGASILVANGGKEPIRLGSATSEGGGFLHVWDWS